MYRNIPAERYIPKSTTETVERAGGIVYLYDTCSAIGYTGQARKSAFNYRFRNEAQRRKHIEDFFAGIEAHEVRKAERKTERQAPHDLQVGDIVYNSWGWEQTNIDWYQVVACTAQYVTLRRIAGTLRNAPGCSPMSGYTRPQLPAEFTREETSKHRAYEGGHINFRHGYGSKWDGKDKYCSWYS